MHSKVAASKAATHSLQHLLSGVEAEAARHLSYPLPHTHTPLVNPAPEVYGGGGSGGGGRGDGVVTNKDGIASREVVHCGEEVVESWMTVLACAVIDFDEGEGVSGEEYREDQEDWEVDSVDSFGQVEGGAEDDGAQDALVRRIFADSVLLDA